MTGVQTVILFYRIDTRFINLGVIGPEKGVPVSSHLAKLLMEKDGDFFIKDNEKEGITNE